MALDKAKKTLQKRLDTKILKLVCPKGMDIDEYRIRCELESIVPSTSNGMFLYWIMTSYGDKEATEAVRRAVVNALKGMYLLDASNEEQCSYFYDAVRALVLIDRFFATDIIAIILSNYKSADGCLADVFDFCRSLNKGFGLTTVEYFN